MNKKFSTNRSIGISFATQYVELLIQFISVLVLARILTPDDIGIFTIAAFLMTLLHVFRDFGVVQYVIQEKELTNEKIQAALGVAVILALSVAIFLYASSGLVAQFYDKPEIADVLKVMALSFAISPLGSLLIGILRREMRLLQIFYIKTLSSLCHVSTAIVLAMNGFGAISLAWANFAGILSFGIMAQVLRPQSVPFMPKFRNIKAVLSFGSTASLGSVANIAGSNAPDLIIGKVLNMAALGYFSRANGLIQLFTRLISGAILPLALPYFAEMHRQGKSVDDAYIKAVAYLTALAWPFFAVMAFLAKPIVDTLYGPNWNESIPVAQLLCIAGAISSVSLFATQALIATGQVRSAAGAQLTVHPFRFVGVIIASTYGLMHIALVLILSEWLWLAIISWTLQKRLNIKIATVFRVCGKSAFVSLVTFLFSWSFTQLITSSTDNVHIHLLTGIAAAATGWALGIYVIKHPFGFYLHRFLPFENINRMLKESLDLMELIKLKEIFKRVAYRSGLLGLYHRFRNKNTLTITMFHRVLPSSDPRFRGADPEWTMSPDTFERCLLFFTRHYNVVTPECVFDALQGRTALPPRSLLVTFDDGWADTKEHAHPILLKHNISALIFIAGAAIDQAAPFWEERLYAFLSTKKRIDPSLQVIFEKIGIELQSNNAPHLAEQEIRQIIKEVGTKENMIQEVIGMIPALPEPPSMVTTEDVTELGNYHAIGGHGMTHRPLTKIRDVDVELVMAKNRLLECLPEKSIMSMSFPHGASSESIFESCQNAGYKFIFSSDPCLSKLNAVSCSAPIGRIHVSERAIVDRNSRFQSSRLADWLFLRPIRQYATEKVK